MKEGSAEPIETVFVEKCDSYETCEPVVHKLLDKCYNWPFVPQHFEDVLIKPNLMMRSPDRRCVTTNKHIIAAIQSWVRLKQTEFKDVLSYGNVSTSDHFTDHNPVYYDAELKEYIHIAKHAISASLVINAPKLKSHYLMKMTCAVKNMFGCVSERKKWHYKLDLKDFAYLVNRACMHIHPQMVLVDAIDVLEGFGPGPRGTPKHLGYLIAGIDPFEVDLAILSFLGLQREQSPIHKSCDNPHGFRIHSDSGVTPLYGAWQMDLPEGEGNFYLEATNKCDYCKKCSDVCPAEAIIPAADLFGGPTKPIFTNKCIKCCVCLEFCPQGAIDVKVHRRSK
jgi:uncharacterized protein (DUF362 family)